MTTAGEPRHDDVAAETATSSLIGDRRMPTQSSVVLAGAVLLVALLGFGVGWLVFGGDSDSDTSSQDVGEFPIGTFVDETISSNVFDFYEDGTWRYAAGSSFVSGAFGISGDLYTEMTHNYAGAPKIPVTYRWTYEDERLTFELVGEDAISSRRSAYDGRTYIRAE